MAIPAAILTIELTRIFNLVRVWLGTGRPYGLTKIGTRQFGRTAVISGSATDVPLVDRKLEVAVQKGQTIPIEVQLWKDNGDRPAPESFPSAISGTVAAASANGTQTVTFGTRPQVECKVTTRIVPAPPSKVVPAPRVRPGSKLRGAIRIPLVAVVEITEILGLYKPGVGARRAGVQAGYTSDDHQGRIYTNRDLTGAWQRKTQLIQLTATVHVISGTLPAGAKIQWTLSDPDDPMDDEPKVHRQWCAYIDANDYPSAGPAGAQGNDNEGTPAVNPPWQKVGAFALSGAAATQATTLIVRGKSSVTLHCPNVLGDNLIVKAEIISAGAGDFFPAQTGVMTMWSRIDVEYIKMASALDLPVADIPGHFEPAFIQLDFAAVRGVPDQPTPFLSTNEVDVDTDAGTYVDANFTHKSNPGWFCLVAAREPHPLPTSPGNQVFQGDVDLKAGGGAGLQEEYIEIPGHFDADFVTFEWGTFRVGFQVHVAAKIAGPDRTRCWLRPHDIQNRFKAADGSVPKAMDHRFFFSPRFRREGVNWVAGGYGMPARVKATVKEPGAFYVAGVSPSLAVGAVDFFAGRTVMFTKHSSYNAAATRQELLTTIIVHELTHAFGMPHKCGFWDYLTPRDHTCLMNYRNHWMLNAVEELDPGTQARVGLQLCGRHLKELRRVHIEDNGALGW